MSAPGDLQDWLIQAGTPNAVLLDLQFGHAVPYTSTEKNVTPYKSVQLAINTNNTVTLHSVITVTLNWFPGTTASVSWTDIYTLWGVDVLNTPTPVAHINVPVRGAFVQVTIAATDVNETFSFVMFGSPVGVTQPNCQGQRQAQGLHLIAVTTPSIANGGALSYFVGPANRDVTGYVHANGASFFVQVFAQFVVAGVVTEEQITVSTPNAVVGTPGLISTVPCHGMALRVVVNNNGAAAATCTFALTDSYS